MPLYEYQCIPEGHRFETRHGINESVTECPECGGEVRRVIHPVGVVFKGSGFYVTDSRQSNPAAKAATKSDSSKSGDSAAGTGESKNSAAGSETPAAG